jgi:hypothetical protein
MNDRRLSVSRFVLLKGWNVEGFRAPAGVLNPDVYDPRIGRRWSMGIWDSGAVSSADNDRSGVVAVSIAEQ